MLARAPAQREKDEVEQHRMAKVRLPREDGRRKEKVQSKLRRWQIGNRERETANAPLTRPDANNHAWAERRGGTRVQTASEMASSRSGRLVNRG